MADARSFLDIGMLTPLYVSCCVSKDYLLTCSVSPHNPYCCAALSQYKTVNQTTDVQRILCNSNAQACGVLVKKGNDEHALLAPKIISNAGAYNTFQTLLPKEVATNSYYYDLLKSI